ncbi:MAG: hypothetical protein JW864_14385 [Spirochaetes bacterium]|nr:hypothetical protein [Spirochaetota bacterium]
MIKRRLILYIVYVIILCAKTAFADETDKIYYGPQISYAGCDLLKGGPTLGLGFGGTLIVKPLQSYTWVSSKLTSIFFLPENEKSERFFAVSNSADLSFEFFYFHSISLNAGFEAVYDYCDTYNYEVSELTIGFLQRTVLYRGDFALFVEIELELGGFDTWIVSAGMLF